MIDQAEASRQINRVVSGKKFDFWLVNAENKFENVLAFLKKTDVPTGAEVFTSEAVYPGEGMGDLLRTECVNEENESETRRAERFFLFKYAREIQGAETFTGAGKALLELTKKKKIKLWLGAPHAETSREKDLLYNAYVLIENGQIRFVHRKKFLWNGGKHNLDSEVGVYETTGTKQTPISLKAYDGIFKNRAYLICQEANAFFCPKWHTKPTHIPEVRDAKPDFVIIPAQWTNKVGTEKEFLKKLALSIARRIKEPVDKFSAVRKQGCLVLVINNREIYVCGPVNEKKVKARVYAEQKERGWIRINNNGVTTGKF